MLDTKGDRQPLQPPTCNTSVVKDNTKELEKPSPSLLPEQSEHQHFQVEVMQCEIEWLREQVRSLQEALADQIQQHQAVEQELQATQQELALMNQEMQRWVQGK